MKKIIGTFLLSIIAIGCSAFGTIPTKKRIERYQSSKNFDQESKTFKNRRQAHVQKMFDRGFKFSDIMKFFEERADAKPKNKMPEIKPNIEEFLKNDGELKVIWFGHRHFYLIWMEILS